MALARPEAQVRQPRPGIDRRAADRPFNGAPTDHSLVQPATHIRRCTFRRVTAVAPARRQLTMYEVECLHPTYDAPLALGDLPAAHAACAACTLPGIFRPDED